MHLNFLDSGPIHNILESDFFMSTHFSHQNQPFIKTHTM